MKLLFGFQTCGAGGVATQLLTRARYFSNMAGVKARFAFRQDRGGQRVLSKYGRTEVAEPWRFRELVAQEQFDAVIVSDAPEYLDALSELARSQCTIVELYRIGTDTMPRSLPRHYDSFVVPSRFAKRTLTQAGVFGMHDPVEIVPFMIDSEAFFPSPGPECPRPIIGWVGGLEQTENWRRFLLLASLLVEGRVEVDFWMVGGAHAKDDLVEALLESIDGLDLSGRVRWFPEIPYPAMRRFYSLLAESGGCLLSTDQEQSFGCTAAEALLSGCPVTAPNCGAIQELVPGAGYLMLYEELEEAASLVRQLIGPAGGGPRGRLLSDLQELRERFGPATLGPAYLNLLMRVIENRRRRTSVGSALEA